MKFLQKQTIITNR